MTNVASINRPKPVDPAVTDKRALWSARALYAVIGILKSDLSTTQAKWTKLLTESTQRMNEPLREEINEDKISGKQAKDMLLTARKFRRERDDLEDEKGEEIKAKKRTIKGFEDALAECLAIEADAGEQSDLFEGQSGVPGMSWASASTVQSVYAAIQLLDEKGQPLNETLRELVVDLGTAGVEAVELNLEAAEAIEADEPPPAANDDGEASDESSVAPVPF